MKNGKPSISLRRAFAITTGGFALLMGAQPLTTFLFPRAETVLKREGLDPAIVGALAPGKKIYVRIGDNPLARLHAMFDFMSVSGAEPQSWDKVGNDTNLAYNRRMSDGICRVYIRAPSEPRFDGVAFLRRSFRGVKAWQNPVTPTRRENFRHTLLHEIAHCNDANQRLPLRQAEGDADYRSAAAQALAEKNPALMDAFIRYSAFTDIFDDTHDTALYMRARQAGETPPSDDAVRDADARVMPFVQAELGIRLKAALGEHGPCGDAMENCAPVFLPPLAETRFNLWRAAADYYLAPKP